MQFDSTLNKPSLVCLQSKPTLAAIRDVRHTTVPFFIGEDRTGRIVNSSFSSSSSDTSEIRPPILQDRALLVDIFQRLANSVTSVIQVAMLVADHNRRPFNLVTLL